MNNIKKIKKTLAGDDNEMTVNSQIIIQILNFNFLEILLMSS